MGKGSTDRRRGIRKYLRRAALSVFPCLLPCFMYCIWGGMEVYTGNAGGFRFNYGEALGVLWPVCALCFAALMAVVPLLRGKAFRLALSVLTAFSLASYIQNLALNLNMGLMEGEAVDWAAHTAHGYVNLGVWALMLGLFTLGLMLLRGKRVARAACGVCAALFTLQAATLGVVTAQYFSGDLHDERNDAYMLSGETQFEVSAEGNVVVFILDYFSNDYFESTLKKYPEIESLFADFTYYDNCDPNYIGTFPSAVHMLTGYEYDNTVTIDQWFQNAWGSESARYIYQTLAEKGYKARFFDSSNSYFGIKYAMPYFDNLISIAQEPHTLHADFLRESMLKLACYRYLPHIFKQNFWMVTSDFYNAVTLERQSELLSRNRAAFYYGAMGGLERVADDGKYFIVQFLRGTHPPYHLDENCRPDDTATLEQTAAAYLKMCGVYLQKLRDQGLYDDATVIITSDHGDKENSMQILYLIKEAGAHKDAMAVNSAPISHAEFPGTILHAVGAEYPYGATIYDFAEGDKRERTVMRNFIDTNYPYVPKYQSTGKGTHTVMYAYTYTGDRKALRKQVRRGPTYILPLTESFN